MSFVPQGLRDAIASEQSKPFDQQVVNGGSGKYLREGEYDVRISGVDVNNLKDRYLEIKYQQIGSEAEHTQRTWLFQQNRKTGKWELDRKFGAVLAACIPQKEAIEGFYGEIMAGNANVFDCLIGMKCHIKLERGDGYTIEGNGDQGYLICDSKTKAQLLPDAYTTVDYAKEAAKEANLKRAFMNVVSLKATHGEENVSTFSRTIQAARQTQVRPAAVAIKVAR